MPFTKSNSFAGKQVRAGATSMLYAVIVIIALILVNWLANRYNKAADTTSNKQFTLSDETKKVVQGLKTDASIVYFDTKRGFERSKPLLDRYANLSSKVHVQYVDYLKNPVEDRAYNITNPGTAYVQIGQRREEARAVTEEGLTGAFIKDLKAVRNVCFVSGSRERPLDGTSATGLSQFKTLLQRDNYEAQSISLLDKTEVPGNCTVLVVAGPQFDYTPNEVNAIKTFVENGGRAMLLLDAPLQSGKEHISDNGALASLLSSWGVTLDKDLVLEANPVGQMMGIGPETPLIHNYGSQPIVNDLNAVTAFPLVQSLAIKNTAKTSVDKLFSTTDDAIATTKLASNAISMADPSNKKGPFTLGAAGTYNGSDPKKSGRFVVIGTSGFLDNHLLHFQGNADLALNAVNWLSSDEDLISIRPKQPDDRRLNLSVAQVNIFRYLDLIAIPLLLIVLGVSIFVKRR